MLYYNPQPINLLQDNIYQMNNNNINNNNNNTTVDDFTYPVINNRIANTPNRYPNMNNNYPQPQYYNANNMNNNYNMQVHAQPVYNNNTMNQAANNVMVNNTGGRRPLNVVKRSELAQQQQQQHLDLLLQQQQFESASPQARYTDQENINPITNKLQPQQRIPIVNSNVYVQQSSPQPRAVYTNVNNNTVQVAAIPQPQFNRSNSGSNSNNTLQANARQFIPQSSMNTTSNNSNSNTNNVAIPNIVYDYPQNTNGSNTNNGNIAKFNHGATLSTPEKRKLDEYVANSRVQSGNFNNNNNPNNNFINNDDPKRMRASNFTHNNVIYPQIAHNNISNNNANNPLILSTPQQFYTPSTNNKDNSAYKNRKIFKANRNNDNTNNNHMHNISNVNTPSQSIGLNDSFASTGSGSADDDADLSPEDNPNNSSFNNPFPARETDPRRLEQRQKQIDLGKNTRAYDNYMLYVHKSVREHSLRHDTHPITPDIQRVCSKRGWDGLVRQWRRLLHAWDDEGTAMQLMKAKLSVGNNGTSNNAQNSTVLNVYSPITNDNNIATRSGIENQQLAAARASAAPELRQLTNVYRSELDQVNYNNNNSNNNNTNIDGEYPHNDIIDNILNEPDDDQDNELNTSINSVLSNVSNSSQTNNVTNNNVNYFAQSQFLSPIRTAAGHNNIISNNINSSKYTNINLATPITTSSSISSSSPQNNKLNISTATTVTGNSPSVGKPMINNSMHNNNVTDDSDLFDFDPTELNKLNSSHFDAIESQINTADNSNRRGNNNAINVNDISTDGGEEVDSDDDDELRNKAIELAKMLEL